EGGEALGPALDEEGGRVRAVAVGAVVRLGQAEADEPVEQCLRAALGDPGRLRHLLRGVLARVQVREHPVARGRAEDAGGPVPVGQHHDSGGCRHACPPGAATGSFAAWVWTAVRRAPATRSAWFVVSSACIGMARFRPKRSAETGHDWVVSY